MLINNKNLNDFKGKLMERNLSTPDFEIVYNWGANSLNYVFEKMGTDKFRTLKIKIDIICRNADELELKKHLLTKELQKSVIKFEDINWYYNGFLTKPPTFTYVMKGNEIAEFELLVVAEGTEQTIEISQNLSNYVLSVGGESETPCILEIIPLVSIGKVNITLNGENYAVKTLTEGRSIFINGIDGRVTEGGQNAFNKVDLWQLPKLKKGNNTITSDNENIKIKVTFKTRL